MRLLKNLFNLFFYSNLFIAICATSLTCQILLVIGEFAWNNPLIPVTFFLTLFTYSAHRIISIGKIKHGMYTERLKAIVGLKPLHLAFSIMALIITPYYFFQLSPQARYLIIFPAIISALYIFPFFKKGKRLRDLPFLKTLAVSIAWMFLCVFLPLSQKGISNFDNSYLALTVEKLFFILSITIPFDIRDTRIDKALQTLTLVHHLGTRKSKIISYFLLMISSLIAYILFILSFYSTYQLFGILASYIVALFVIFNLTEHKHDYWFSGALDGTIILQSILVWISHMM